MIESKDNKAASTALKAADLRLRRQYGISLEQYNKVFLYQKKACAICKIPHIPGKPRLSVDHCHLSGELRGLLCWGCNRKIAAFKDNIALLKAAATYLTKPPIRVVLGMVFSAPGRIGSKKRAKLLKKLELTSMKGNNVG